MKWIRSNLKGRKRLAIAVIAVALCALAGYLMWGDGASAATYMTAKVERGNLRNTVTATGTLQAVTTVQVGSQASGTISALYVDFNSTVRKGQVIAQLDPATTQAQVEQSRANLEQARASLVQARAGVAQSRAGVTDAQAKALAARSTVQNQQAGVSGAQANLAVLKAQMDDALSFLRQEETLLSSGVISRREYETAQTSYKTAEARYNQAVAQVNQAVLSEKSSAGAGIAQSQAQLQQTHAQVQQSEAQVQQAEAQVQQAEAALNLAQISLSHTTIRSPIDGVVVSRDVDVGQTVAASLSAPTLFTIANDLTRMQIMANIDQADIGLVEQAKSVNFTVDAYPGQQFKGTIEQMRLNPQNVQNVVTYNVVIDVSNPEQKLKPGMTANLEITIDERNNVLKVPNAALRFTPQETTAQRSGANRNRAGGASGQGARQMENRGGGGAANSNAPTNDEAQTDGARGARVAPAASPVLEGQIRRVWVLGPDGRPQPRRIKIGLTDGASTEVIEGDLREGEVVITGQNVTGSNRPQTTGQTPPGFGGAPRTGGGGGRGGR
ncbi:MAG TPA: efflux RND transporter periplasmic adaptor subunit [Pyrinomonadaceae bacterium]|jgi:HlyD family secretion protein|nr:efflux RND transporter periplasmic adaptor subunit [Pyrinomonadaceae bacterium]